MDNVNAFRDKFDELIQVIETGNIDALRFFLDTTSPKFLMMTDSRSRTPLHVVTEYGNSKSIRLLMERTPESVFSILDSWRQTPLHTATARNDDETKTKEYSKAVEEMTKKSSREVFTAQDFIGNTPLHNCVGNSNSNILKVILPQTSLSVLDKIPWGGFYSGKTLMEIAQECDSQNPSVLIAINKEIQSRKNKKIEEPTVQEKDPELEVEEKLHVNSEDRINTSKVRISCSLFKLFRKKPKSKIEKSDSLDISSIKI